MSQLILHPAAVSTSVDREDREDGFMERTKPWSTLLSISNGIALKKGPIFEGSEGDSRKTVPRICWLTVKGHSF